MFLFLLEFLSSAFRQCCGIWRTPGICSLDHSPRSLIQPLPGYSLEVLPLRHKKALEYTRWRINLFSDSPKPLWNSFQPYPGDLNPTENRRQDFTFASMLYFYFFSDISLQNTTSSFYNSKSVPAPHWQRNCSHIIILNLFLFYGLCY